MAAKPKLTAEQRQLILEVALARLALPSDKELAREFGVSVSALYKTVERQGGSRRPASYHRIVNSMRCRIYAVLKGKSEGALFRRLGYTKMQLISHIENRFKEGMNWDNYGLWQVDHIKPCASFDQSDKNQFKQCWDISNLQPLWAIENRKKGSKLIVNDCTE
jgi:hypothetical protein